LQPSDASAALLTRRLLVGTDDGLTILVNDRPVGLRAQSVEGVAGPIRSVLRLNDKPEVILAAGPGAGICRSDDAGKNWRRSDSGLGSSQPWCLTESGSLLFAGLEPAGVAVSNDEGKNWKELDAFHTLPGADEWKGPGGSPARVRALAADPNEPSLLYAGIEAAGIARSEDAGQTWQKADQGIHLDVHSLAVSGLYRRFVYAATGGGFYKTTDGGAEWRESNAGLTRLYARPLVARRAYGETLFLAAADGPPSYPGPAWSPAENANAAIFHSVDYGARWEEVKDGLPSPPRAMFGALCFDAQDPYIVWAGDLKGGIFAAFESGRKWVLLFEGLRQILAILAE
jgi:hypothetical protein